MKSYSLLFIALLLFNITTLAQEGWFSQGPLPSANPLNSVDYINEQTAWATVGGNLICTTDGGSTWFTQHRASCGVCHFHFPKFDFLNSFPKSVE